MHEDTGMAHQSNFDQAIELLRSAIAVITEDAVTQAISKTGAHRSDADAKLLLAGRDVAALAEACAILRRRFRKAGI